MMGVRISDQLKNEVCSLLLTGERLEVGSGPAPQLGGLGGRVLRYGWLAIRRSTGVPSLACSQGDHVALKSGAPT
jgi:hypothetical protein